MLGRFETSTTYFNTAPGASCAGEEEGQEREGHANFSDNVAMICDAVAICRAL